MGPFRIRIQLSGQTNHLMVANQLKTYSGALSRNPLSFTRRIAYPNGPKPPRARVHPPSPFLIVPVPIARPVSFVRSFVLSSSLVCNQSQLVPSLSTMEPRGSIGTESVVGLVRDEPPRDNEFVFVSFRRHVNVVDYRDARVDEEQGEGGQAARENDA